MPLCSDAQEMEIWRRYFYLLFPRMKYMTQPHHRYVKFLKNGSKDVPFFSFFFILQTLGLGSAAG